MIDWERIRIDYETGSTQSELARRYGVSRSGIQKHIQKENWQQDISGAVDRLVEAKVAGVVAGCNPKKKAEALGAAAEQKAAVIERHRQEWEEQERLSKQAIVNADFEMAKLAKITAETLKIRQEGERKAWGISDHGAGEQTITTKVVLFGDD